MTSITQDMAANASASVVAVVGLGYVGLPLAVEFGKCVRTIGFDISREKIVQLASGIDATDEVGSDGLKLALLLELSADPAVLAEADFIVIAVPTPVDAAHRPDFGPLIAASASVGRYLKKGAVVVFESTVYPGATEEVCIPEIERPRGLKWGEDFAVAYSPERVNPGDKEHTLTTVVKVVSGDTSQTADKVAALYAKVIKAGVHRASSIRVAEAAKVIENTQRDLNIALMNELAIIFDKIGIDTNDVLEAAGTKWNFLKFKPGLVGGHCIGVDPYYLTHKAEMLDYHPQVILAGRRINDSMAKFVAEKTVKLVIGAGVNPGGARVAVLGVTFKENCRDVRNSQVPKIVAELASYGIVANVCDPVATAVEVRHEYGFELVGLEALAGSDAVVVAVSHHEFAALTPAAMSAIAKPGAVVVDVKAALDGNAFAAAGYRYWRM